MRICPSCAELYPDDAAFCPLDGVGLKKATDPYLGRTIAGRFRLIRRLGAGGMSAVYLARHVMIDRLSAIKILRQDLGLDPNHRERFLREARAVNRINHRNIVEITDLGELDGLAYLVMEYVAGESLLTHIQRGGFSWDRAAKVGLQIASALGRAHQMGVIHRDLKPENILLLQAPDMLDQVKLTDFGIAKILDAPALTFSEQMFGTPGYIAPEYLDGKSPDGRADLYALGVVIYEMLTTVLPYDARGQSELLLKPLTCAPIPPGTRVAGLPPELESLVLSLLARQPEDRPADAFIVFDALTEMLRVCAPSKKTSMTPRDAEAPLPPPRDISPTIAEVESQTQDLHVTANVGGLHTSAMTSRWAAALRELELTIDRARGSGDASRAKKAGRASDLAERARELIANVERASRQVADSQAKVDRLEASGREFKATLGRALDALVHDRSRERAHHAAIQARQTSVIPPPRRPIRSTPPKTIEERESDVNAWEGAALAAEEQRMSGVERDLSFQISELELRLEVENVQLDRGLAEATGMLEGAISAVRRLTNELVRTLDDAAGLVAPRVEMTS